MGRVRNKAIWVGLVAVVVLGSVAPASAQAPVQVTATSGIAFISSPDHDTVDPIAGPIVTGYQLNVMIISNGALAFTRGLGKPTPVAGEIVVRPIAEFGKLARNLIHTMTVSATGPGGAGVSPTSDPFGAFDGPAPPRVPGKPSIR